MLTQSQLQNLKPGDVVRYRGDICTVVYAIDRREHFIHGTLVGVLLRSDTGIQYGHDALSRLDPAELIREG